MAGKTSEIFSDVGASITMRPVLSLRLFLPGYGDACGWHRSNSVHFPSYIDNAIAAWQGMHVLGRKKLFMSVNIEQWFYVFNEPRKLLNMIHVRGGIRLFPRLIW